MQYDYKPEKVIDVGDSVFDKVETINILLAYINRTLKELEEINKINNNRLDELEKSLNKLRRTIRGNNILW